MKTINHKQLKEKLDSGGDFVFLNVLPREQFENEHIPGSDNIPYDDEDFEEKVRGKAVSPDTEIIVYCAHIDCDASDKAAHRLERNGFNNVVDFGGGLREWKEAGHKTEGRRRAA